MARDTTEPRFSWLLFSDFRFRAYESDVIRSGMLEKFWLDLKSVYDEAGPFDAVFFAGNLVEKGDADAWSTCSAFTAELFSRLKEMGSAPVLLCVPGPHDMVRSGVTDHFGRAMPDDRPEDWMELRTAFSPYDSWARRWRLPNLKRGAAPGDFSAMLRKGPFSVGVAGLNTALTQGSDRAVKWVPVTRQRMGALAGGSMDAWVEKHPLRFLLSHHPPWLFRSRKEESPRLDSFHLHLCGHSDVEWEWPEPETGSPIVVRAPRFRAEGGEAGYVAGSVDLIMPDASIWYRTYSRDNRWGPAHALHQVFQIPFTSETKFAAPALLPYRLARPDEPIYLESLHLTGFRCFDELSLDLHHHTQLGGEWTCIAGINGAGKTSILQGIGLALLGHPAVRELGGERLARMCRSVDGRRARADIEAVLRLAGSDRTVRLHLAIDSNGETAGDPEAVWQELRSRAIVGYGATRNISYRTQSDNLSPDVRRQITLFEPLSQLASASVLLNQQPGDDRLVALIEKIVDRVFEGELQVETAAGGLRFVAGARDQVEAMDLPDGFRVSAAWITDLCATWYDKAPELVAAGDPAAMQGIVLIDEIDLHLHPALQRRIVPKLRATLPLVQWIVTTHSPLVLANFDSNEIIALDRSRDGHIRPLDRQIMGFSTDQIYQWLMGTPPTGEAIEEVLAQNESSGEPSDDDIATLLEVAPDVDERQARDRVEKLKGAIERLEP